MAKGNRKVEQCLYQMKINNSVVSAPVEKEEEAKEEVKEETEKYTEEGLLQKTNAELRDILDSFDGAPSGKGKTKSQLVSLILAEQSK